MIQGRIFPLFLAVMVFLAGCSTNTASTGETSSGGSQSSSGISAVTQTSTDSSGMFTDRDMEIGYDEGSSAQILLSGDSASCSSNAVEISGSTITITDEGTYLLSGTLNDGMIVVNAGDSDKVQLVLDGVDITSSTSAAIWLRSRAGS